MLSQIPDSFSFFELSEKPLHNIPINLLCASESHVFALPQFNSFQTKTEERIV